MAFPKPDPALVDLLLDAAAAVPDVEVRRMFGCPALFLGGNMLGGVFADAVNLRLPEAERAAALARPGFTPFVPMEGRPMREYVCLSREAAESPAELRAWLGKAVVHARTLPVKAKKAARRSG